jgi:uncharacterized protein YgiM (DUF1202 family)
MLFVILGCASAVAWGQAAEVKTPEATAPAEVPKAGEAPKAAVEAPKAETPKAEEAPKVEAPKVEAPAAEKYPTEGEVVGDSVSVRSTNSINGYRLALVFKGDKLKVLGEQDGWYKVELPTEFTMWVSKDFVSVAADKTGKVTGDNVRARSGAGTQFHAIGNLDRGRKVDVVDEKEGWVQCKFVAGDTGFVARQFVKLAGEEAPKPAEGVKPPEEGVVQPPKPPQTEAEKAAEKTVVDTFNKAEEIYKQEVTKPSIMDWKLDEAEALFAAVLEKTKSPGLTAKAKSRLSVIELAKKYQEAAKPAAEAKRLLEAREKQIEEEAAMKRKLAEERSRPAPVDYLAAGTIEKLASGWLQPATHKLVKDNRIVYLLYSENVDLGQCEGKTVGIQGSVDTALKWPIPAVKVTGIVANPGEAAPPAPPDETVEKLKKEMKEETTPSAEKKEEKKAEETEEK